jgi:hypothetical protein
MEVGSERECLDDEGGWCCCDDNLEGWEEREGWAGRTPTVQQRNDGNARGSAGRPGFPRHATRPRILLVQRERVAGGRLFVVWNNGVGRDEEVEKG